MPITWTRAALAVAAAIAAAPAPAASQDRAPAALEITVTRPHLGQALSPQAVTVYTAEDIARSPAQTLPEFLGQAAGIQFRDLFGGTAGARATVDIRGFGALGAQNSLVLVNGRRLNDIDIAAVEFVNIPLESIDRVEILRGNSAAVLYGDGAVGGAINIVTRPGAVFSRTVADVATGSYGLAEANLSLVQASLDWSVGVDVNSLGADGARSNSDLRQRGLVADVRRFVPGGEWFLHSTVDSQTLGLPGARKVTATTRELATEPDNAATPNDHAAQSGHRTVVGVSRRLDNGGELVLDGGLRVKAQDSVIVSPSGPAFDTTTNTRLSTLSLTPRFQSAAATFGLDYTYSDYNQVARSGAASTEKHRYDLKQHAVALYGQQTFAVSAATSVTAGARVQDVRFTGGDILDPNATVAFGGTPFDGHRNSERHGDTAWAAHLGVGHALAPGWEAFGRVGRSFRAPTVDERILSTAAYNSFRLRTQTSWDMETGLRYGGGRWSGEARAWMMNVRDELHFNAATFLNQNLDPTRRIGVEAEAAIALARNWSLDVQVAWIRAEFRRGANKGKDLPLVSPWTGSASLRWQAPSGLEFAGTVNAVAPKWMDNDDANRGAKIPGAALFDARVAGERGPWRGSLQINNLLDKQYFNYAVASTTTVTTYNAYPLAGRTFRIEVRRAF